jgi:hypothetical protein
LQSLRTANLGRLKQPLRLSFQSLKIRNDVLTISGVRNGDEHLRAVNVAYLILEPLIERLLVPRDVCRRAAE